MTTLKDEGAKAVESWTANKNINVFEKKLIFVPINANLHWSLCVVVNPGHITNHFYGRESTSEKHSWLVKKMYGFIISLNLILISMMLAAF